MERAIATTLVLVAATTAAYADPPSLDEVRSAVRKLQDAVMAGGETVGAPDPTAAADLVVAPFTYGGFEYSSVDRHAMTACKRRWVRSQRFPSSCLAI